MLFFRSFINFFIVPVISLVLIEKKGDVQLEPSFELFLKYCVIVACNIPLTRVFTFFAKIVTGMEVEADSSYYTICAIFAAVLIMVLKNIYFEFRKSNADSDGIDEDENKLDDNRN